MTRIPEAGRFRWIHPAYVPEVALPAHGLGRTYQSKRELARENRLRGLQRQVTVKLREYCPTPVVAVREAYGSRPRLERGFHVEEESSLNLFLIVIADEQIIKWKLESTTPVKTSQWDSTALVIDDYQPLGASVHAVHCASEENLRRARIQRDVSQGESVQLFLQSLDLMVAQPSTLVEQEI